MKKIWKLKPQVAEQEFESLQEALQILPFLAQLLWQRGIRSLAEAKRFFTPTPNQQHSPELLKDIGKAVARLKKAHEAQEKILIYGDYDVDGTTGTALLLETLQTWGFQVDFFIPSRSQGYGVTEEGVRAAEYKNYDLIITVDCGIKSSVLLAGLPADAPEVIVCDHHLPEGGSLPKAVAILNPMQANCAYPFKGLSGCGVAFKLLEALGKKLSFDIENLHQKIALLALSICADMVKIRDENRYFVAEGLRQMREAPLPWAAALFPEGEKREKLRVRDLVFRVAPLINAAGRLTHAEEALALLRAKDLPEAQKAVARLDELNQQRKSLDQRIFKEAQDNIETFFKEDAAFVLASEDWEVGVLGIVAARCAEQYQRPAIILRIEGEEAIGSARSGQVANVHRALEEVEALLTGFGGHANAAGLRLPVKNIVYFREKFTEKIQEQLGEEILQTAEADVKIKLKDLTPRSLKVLRHMPPFGPGNMRPKFWIENLQLSGIPRTTRDGSHLIFSVQQGQKLFRCIAFGHGHRLGELKAAKHLRVIAVVKEEKWRGKTQVSLEVRDFEALATTESRAAY